MARIRLYSAVGFVLLASLAQAQVDCDTPDDLCVGDPCVIGAALVGSSCIIDFGPRTLVIAGRLRMASDGELALSAGSIRVEGSIENLRPSGPPSGGPRITLDADDDIELTGRIRLAGAQSGTLLPGEVTLDAGDDLTVRGALTATTSPTTILYRATSGDVSFRGKVNPSRDGGAITFESGGATELDGSLRRLEDIAVVAGGAVDLRGSVTPRVSLQVDAGGAVTLDTSIRSLGADIVLRGDAGVTVTKSLYVIPLFIFDGTLEFESANGSVTISKPIRASEIAIAAGTDVVLDAAVSASPPARSGGTITIASTGGDVLVTDRLRAQSGDGTQPGDGAGGHIDIIAQDLVSIAADVQVNAFPGRDGAPGGTLEIDAGRIVVADARFDADGDAPGPNFPSSPPAGFRLTSTAGEVSLDGIFQARGGPSVIEAVAAMNLTASGSFQVAPDGCVGLSAGGTLNVSGATFDVPFVADCP
jgi:hypothetical protein